jgi:hypothetical protein
MKNFKRELFTTLFLSVLTCAPVQAQEDAGDESSETITSELRPGIIDGVGAYKLRIDNYGAPVSIPLRISVQFRCGMDSLSKVIIEDLEACGVKSFEKSGDALVLSYLKSDGKTEKCSKAETLSFKLRTLNCSKK